MFSQSTLTVASLVALVAALPQSQTGTCPANWGSFSSVEINGQSMSHCCPGMSVSGTSFDNTYCCIGGTPATPGQMTQCPGYPYCENGPTAVKMGLGPSTPGLPCQATAYFTDPNYSSIVAAVISGTAAAEVSTAVQMDSSSMAPPMASATNAGDQTQASGTAVPVATSAAASSPVTTSAAAGTSPAATTADADTTAVTGQATSATTGSGSSTSSSASSSGSKGAGAQVTALPMAGALVMAAGGLVLAAL